MLISFLQSVCSSNHYFIENKGQIIDTEGKIRSDIICYAKLDKYSVYITNKGIAFTWCEYDNSEQDASKSLDTNSLYTIYRKDIDFVNAGFQQYEFRNQSNVVFNYYLSYLEDNILNVSTFSSITFKSIYPLIDLEISIKNNKLLFDFFTSNITALGAISISNIENDAIVFNPSDCYQVRYHLKGDEISTPNITKEKSNLTQEFNSNVEWTTFLGGENLDFATSVSSDKEGNIIVGGISKSQLFPTTEGVFERNSKGDHDIFISKFSADGTLIWSTLAGGSYFDTLNDLEVASDSTIWYCGETGSQDYPLTDNAYQKKYGGDIGDGIIGRFTRDGKRIYISYYGGDGYDTFNELALNSKGDIFFTGPTTSNNFPTSDNAIKNNKTGSYDGFLVGFDNYYSRLYSSLWGGDSDDWGEGITIDNYDNILIMGYTNSENYLTKNAYQPKIKGGLDGYLAKFDSNLNLIWSTYLGGSGNDYFNKLKHDKYNNVYLRGCTNSSDLPVTIDAIQKNYAGNNDLFIMKYDFNGSLKMATYFGGTDAEGWDHVNAQFGGIDVDNFGNIAISGNTGSANLPITENAYQKKIGKYDGSTDSYIIVLDSNHKLLYSSYFGGLFNEKGYDVCFNSTGDLINVGYTSSPDFPIIKDAFQSIIQGNFDGYIIKFAPPAVPKDTCDETEFYYMDFNNDESIIYNGKAYLSQDFIRLTTPTVNRVGAIWYKYLMPVKNGFTTKFKFRMSEGINSKEGDSSLPGADGIAFVVQHNSTKIFGGNGGLIGYEPIPNSLAVEYDLFSNDKHQIEILSDPNGNHVAVMSLGKEPNSADHASGSELGINKDIIELKSNNTIYYSKIDYNIEPGTMRVYLSDKENVYGNPIIEIKNLDLTKLLNLYGDEWAYVGFTSATGSSYQNHDILAWEFCPKPTNSIQTGVEENNPILQNSGLIYPNPVGDEMYYRIGENESATIQIFDITGTVAKSYVISGKNNRIDISELSAGCWFARIENNNGIIAFEKFVKY